MDMFQEHPDGRIYVRRDDQESYDDTIRNFQIDLGQNLEPMPPGIDERIYVPGRFHALNNSENTIAGGPMPWEFGDYCIAILPQLLAKQAERNKPPPPPPLPPVRVITRRQFFQAAAMKGMITQEEALDAVRHGTIPPKMQQGVDTLPPEEQFESEMKLSGNPNFDRYDPIINKWASVMGMPPAAMDAMWEFAANL